MFQLSLRDLIIIIVATYGLGVITATWLYLILGNSVSIRPPRYTWRDCDERYD